MLTQAVFLVGGRGTRLGSLTDHTPKPMILVGERPFISYLIDNAIRHGLNDIILLAGYRAEIVNEAWGEGSPGKEILARQGVRIRVVKEGTAAGTAGALVHVKDMLDDFFLFMNGDSFFDFNWLDLLTIEMRGSDALARLALRKVADGVRYGWVELADGHISAFRAHGRAGEALINGGVYLLNRQLLDYVDHVPMSIEHDVFPILAAQKRLAGRAYDGFFIDIGIPEDLARADRTMAEATVRPALFLDRDGVINVDHGYVHQPADFEWIEGAKDAIKKMNDAGYFVFVITNQAGVARGYYSEQDVDVLHHWINAQLQEIGAHIDRFEYCPDHPDGTVDSYRHLSDRRKPGPGMLRACIARWPVQIGKSLLVGDKQSDLTAAAAAGIPGYLFEGGNLLHFIDRIEKI